MKEYEMINKQFPKLILAGLLCSFSSYAKAAEKLDRTVLPIHKPEIKKITTLDARNAKRPDPFKLNAPEGAPNVIIVLIDDMGFGHSSAFGGPINMPTLEKVANEGIRYNRFHTTALCSPTRSALLTGRNHHTVNFGSIAETGTAFPGNTGIRPNTTAPLPDVLRMNGYSTAAFGKIHETPPWEISPVGPFVRWPTHSGFERFYGFIGGETNQWFPNIYDNTTHIEPEKKKGYHFMTDMTDKAITYVKTQKALTPEKPFFVYFAPGATHAPHHAPKKWIDKYKGKFDDGWDKLREKTLAKQKELGVVPKNTKLAGKPKDIKDWDKLSKKEKELFARQMEIFAGFGEYTDAEIGRLLKTVEDLGEKENTVVIYIAGDNGSSAEGGLVGLFNENTFFNSVTERFEDVYAKMDQLGGPMSYNHFAAGWAVAGNAPFMWTKQIAANFGGTRNGMAISWPKRIKAKNEIRSQFHHVIDIAPTILELVNIPAPTEVNGFKQKEIEGVSMAYTFDNAKAEDRHKTQYFELFGNRAIYHNGWFAGTVHRVPWETTPLVDSFDKDTWELYNVDKDFSQSNNLAMKNPEKLKEMQALFLEEARKYNVLPLDDRSVERFDPNIAGRPDLMDGRTKLTITDEMQGLMENAFINTKNTSHTITANIDVKDMPNGVIIAQGGRFGGWSLFTKNGKLNYTYNWVGLERYTVSSNKTLPKGKSKIEYKFTYDGGGYGKGGKAEFFVNGEKFGEGRIKQTAPNLLGLDETAEAGRDEGTPVTEAYTVENSEFNGNIEFVTIELSDKTAELAE